MRINKLRKHIALSLIFMIMFSLVGCVNNENNENSYGGIVGSTEMIRAEKKGNFHLFATKIDSLDPYKVKNYYTQQVLNLIYEGLTVVGSNGELNPGLAKTWTTTDNKSWQFELHSNITWHSGKAFTTNDILYTYNYLKNMNTSIYKKRISNIDNLMINSKNKITFILKKEDADFPYKTAFPILCAKRSKKPNGTGPYAYKSVSSKQLV